MDVTLGRVSYNKRKAQRSGRAWTYHFAHPDSTCRYCPHDHTTHLTLSRQPYFLTTDGERRIVARNAEIVRALLHRLRERKSAPRRCLCYQRNTSRGGNVGGSVARRGLGLPRGRLPIIIQQLPQLLPSIPNHLRLLGDLVVEDGPKMGRGRRPHERESARSPRIKS